MSQAKRLRKKRKDFFERSGMWFYLDEDHLRLALAELEEAKASGFLGSKAVFRVCYSSSTEYKADNYTYFQEILERAGPEYPTLDWGFGRKLRKRFNFINGVLKKKETISEKPT